MNEWFEVSGFVVGWSNRGIVALCALFYSATIRISELGLSNKCGHDGAVLGPIIGGLIVAVK